MRTRRPARRYTDPSWVAAALIAALTLTGCSANHEPGDGEYGERKDTPAVTPTGPDTHDGAVPVSVVTTWVQKATRGNGDLACGFGTEKFQAATVDRAVELDLSKPQDECAQAAKALAKAGYGPAPVTEYVVDAATEDHTVLTLMHGRDAAEEATLTNENGVWLIDTITPTGTSTD